MKDKEGVVTSHILMHFMMENTLFCLTGSAKKQVSVHEAWPGAAVGAEFQVLRANLL